MTLSNLRRSVVYYSKAITERIDLKILVSLLWSFLLTLFGQPTAGVWAFVIICVIDFSMGVFLAKFIHKNFNRDRFFRGVGKYVAFGIALIIARQIDIVIADLLDFMKNINTNIILFKYRMLGILAVHEGLSVLGKLSGLWVPIPKGMLLKLNQYREALESVEPEKQP